MHPGVLQFPRFPRHQLPFILVLSGLMLAALIPVGPASAGEVGAGEIGAGVPAVPWQGLPDGGGEAGSWHGPARFSGLEELEFVNREADEGLSWRGLFFFTGDDLGVGAQGSFDPNSGNLRAIIALKLKF